MADDNIDLQLNLDSSGFVQGANQAAAASAALASQVGGTERHVGMLGKTLSLVTPGRLFTGAAITSAAAYQEELKGMSATAAVTHQSMSRLQTGMAALARSLPVGNRGAVEITATLQQMGYSGRQQITTINELGKAYARLGMATGQNASVIGRQMTSLSRAFGASDSDTARFTKMSDSLTKVTAKIGGSSSDILSFSKSIAPMARSAGIGQTAVMGISAAFSKMGEDGYGAATAMNKMLTDLNRSVRDGSSEMGTYASIVGKTRTEFEALFKSDPTKALGMLTKSLGSGPTAERNLERIGLDGVRTSRVFQALGQQGGIEKAAQTAVSGYGDGSTKRAADASVTLADQFTMLRAATAQVTEALGRPFLGALGNVVKVAGLPARGAASVLNTSFAQHALGIGIPAVMGLVGLRALGGLGNNLAVGRHLLFNNRITQGFAQGMSGEDGGVAQAVRQTENYRAMQRLGMAGPAPANLVGETTRGVYNAGRGFGAARQDYTLARQEAHYNRLIARGMPWDQAFDQATAPTASIGQQVRSGILNAPRTLANVGRIGYQVYQASMTDSARQLREPDAMQRQGTILNRSGLGGLRDELKSVNAAGGSLGTRMGMMGATIRNFSAQTNASSGVVRSAAKVAVVSLETTGTGLRALAATAKATAAALGLASSEMRGGVGIAGRAMGAARTVGGSLLGLVGGVQGAAFIGGTYAVSKTIGAVHGEMQKSRDDLAAHRDSSMSSILDTYRESVGGATDAVQTFAEQVNSANKALGRQNQTYDEAAQISEADQQEARNSKNRIGHHFSGNAAQIAEQVRAVSPTGMLPQDLQTIKVDLLRQMPRQQVEAVMKDLNGNAFGQGPQSLDFNKILSPGAARGHGMPGDQGNSIWDKVGHVMGYGMGSTNTTKQQSANVQAALGAIGQTRLFNEQHFGNDYARQEAGRQLNAAFRAAMKTGNTEMAKKIAQQGGDDLGANINMGALGRTMHRNTMLGRDFQGSLTDYLASHDKSFRGSVQGMDFNGKGGLSATQTVSGLTSLTTGIDTFGKALSNNAKDVDSALNKTVQAFLAAPGDTQKMRDAMSALAGDVHATGGGFVQLTDRALQTAKAMGDATSDVSKLAMAVAQRAIASNEANAGFQGRAVTTGNRFRIGMSLIRNADNTELGQQNFDQGRQIIQTERENVRQQMASRLQMQFDYQKQSRRSQEDFTLQTTYAYTDYHKNLARSDEDYQIGRQRAQRDFNIQIAQGQEDFLISRQRANRDFNKSIRRANEDAAKAMYDPYKRVQVEAVSDLGTLMVNLGEQNEVMARQKRNLDELRHAGVNNNVIDQLGLNKSENAQQLDRMVGDITTGGKSAAGALNKMVADRMKDAGVLASDTSNVDRKRAKEDFNQSLRDQNTDFNKGVKRNRESFARSLSDQAKDYGRALARQLHDFMEGLNRQQKAFDLSLTRQKTDIADSQKEILGSFDQLASATQDAMSGKAVDFRTLMKDTLQGTIDDAQALQQKYPWLFNSADATPPVSASATSLGRADKSFSVKKGQSVSSTGGYDLSAVNRGDSRTLLEDLAAMSGASLKVSSTNGGKHANDSYHYKNEALDFTGSASNMDKLANFIYGLNKAGKIRATELIHMDTLTGQKWGLKNAQNFNYSNELWKEHAGHVHLALSAADAKYVSEHFSGTTISNPTHLAVGGVVTKATRALIGEGKSAEAVIPLDGRGVAVIARALTQYMTGPDAQRLMTGGRGDRITYTGNNFTYDHSTKISAGDIHVESNDPTDMARKLAAKARRDNLTATSTRKR